MKKPTPQELADLVGIYVAMDKNGDWWFYFEEPTIEKNAYWVAVGGGYKYEKDEIEPPPNHDWHKYFRPYEKPVIVKEEKE